MEENSEVVERAVERLEEQPINKVVNEMSFVRWLPYFEMEMPHHLDPKKGEKMKEVEEIYNYFVERVPSAPFEAFKTTASHIAPLMVGETKLQKVLRFVRLMKLQEIEHDRH